MIIPRLMIAGTHSGVGKTTICTALMALLTQNGLNVQPYKVGPDYIDPGYHHLATGQISRNLDAWMLGESKVQELFTANAEGKDIAVIEGVMGLFDGVRGETDFGSTAHIAKLTSTPVVLILDVRSMARSAAALVKGFVSFDPDLKIGGLILNRVGSASHYQMLEQAISEVTDIPILGYLPKNLRIEMPERHLGLVPATEGGILTEALQELIDALANTVNVEGLLELARRSQEFDWVKPLAESDQTKGVKLRIGLAQDQAFSFYYRDGLDYLEQLGVEWVPFSPIADTQLPDALDGLFIGGGFPEMFLAQLATNESMKLSIQRAHGNQMPIYAECGGYMYLTEAISDFQGQSYPMVGLIPYTSAMQKRLVAMGYVEACAMTDNLVARAGETYRGHEFHYSQMLTTDHLESDMNPKPAVQLRKNRDGQIKYDGYSTDRLFASYVHIHWAAWEQGAQRFVSACAQYQQERLRA